MEQQLIACLADPSLHERFARFLDGKSLSREAQTCIKDFREYHNGRDYSEQGFNWDNFIEWFFVVRHPTFKPEKAEIYRTLFNSARTIKLSNDNEILQALLERDTARKIAYEADKIASGESSGDLSDVQDCLDSWYEVTSKLSQNALEEEPDFLDLINKDEEYYGALEWRLECLNRSVGFLRKGYNICIAGRPEIGKSTLVASELSYMAGQLIGTGKKLLYFNNEESSDQFRRRIYQAYIGMTDQQIKTQRDEAHKKASEIKGLFHVIDAHTLNMKDVEDIIRSMDCALVVFDQLRKINSTAEGVDKMQQLFYAARQIAIEYAPVISLHQASDRAEGNMWVPDTEMYEVRTAAQGELDIQIMLGAQDKKSRQRGLNIVKNKGSQLGRAEPACRHGQFVVEIQHEIARYKDIGNFD